ncbi:MAG: SPOR domain-containing protein [Bacteroidales bacterium]|nr:SPOR domain-containing protein [Bacteroidales bacterium]
MNKIKSINPALLFISILFLLPTFIYGQESKKNIWKDWSVNINGGVSLFYGDVENYEFFPTTKNKNEWRYGYGLMLQKGFGDFFTLRGQLFNGKLAGSKRMYRFWFEADIFEASMSGTFNISNVFKRRNDRLVNFYGHLGIGWANWETQLKHFDNDIILNENGNDNTGSGLFGRTLEPVIPFGIGIDFNINDHWSIIAEGSLRPVKSDKLDAKVGMFEYDFYSFNFVGITYKFGPYDEVKPDLPVENLLVEETLIQKEPEVVIEPEPEVIIPPKIEPEIVAVEEPEPAKTVDEKLLDKEYRTGLYESPWPGVNFTVQIAASRTKMDPDVFRNKFGLSGEIQINEGDGWYRYSIGNYIKYWKAKENKNILVTRNAVEGAFVVAYKDSKRITLNELVNDSGEFAVKQKGTTERSTEEIAYSVQVLATRNGNISTMAIREMFEIDTEVYKEFNNGTYQYTAGNFASYPEAAKLRNKIKAHGISGAFVVGYKNGQRTDLKSILR